MATASKSPNRTSFLRELLQSNPDVTEKQAREAWKQSGSEGDISSSLFYNTKSALNKKSAGRFGRVEAVGTSRTPTRGPKAKRGRRAVGGPRAQANGAPAAEPTRKPAAGDRRRVLVEAEGDIDRLIFKLMAVPGLGEVEDALREARRLLVVRGHKG